MAALPRTPEPMAQDDDYARAPSPPRPRLKLKRRNVSQLLSAPTQQFLASVAAADIPIPSIEEPEIAPDDADMTDSFNGMNPLSIGFGHLSHHLYPDGEMDLSLKLRGRQFSIPKTPAPGLAPSLSPTRFPNWSTESSFSSSSDESSPEPDYASSRPSTSRSTHTSSSIFSRLSQFSDRFLSPEVEGAEKPGPDDGTTQSSSSSNSCQKSSGKERRAPWTKAMSAHLWSTYTMYLQDPRVTPFRTGKSCIPPHGVCLRVAREAKRSWKGSKIIAVAPKSGSSTPKAEAAATFITWPHTCAATRTHLRELCKRNAAVPGGLGLRYMSRSPTPFNALAHRNRKIRCSTPMRTSSFATRDIGMSLTVCTSEVMQPHGPLAQLTSSSPAEEPVSPRTTNSLVDPEATPTSAPLAVVAAAPTEPLAINTDVPAEPDRARLGSPFQARSYGPSSSTSLAAVLGLTGPRNQSQTTEGTRRTLQSPVRLSRSGTQRRRTTVSARMPPVIGHGHRRQRPSLGSDLWVDPTSRGISSNSSNSRPIQKQRHARAASQDTFGANRAAAIDFFSSLAPALPDDIFASRPTNQSGSLGSSGLPRSTGGGLASSATAPELSQLFSQPLPAPVPSDTTANMPPPRLGSPFSATNTSFSFPNRFFQPDMMSGNTMFDTNIFTAQAAGRGRPFATVQEHQAQPQPDPFVTQQPSSGRDNLAQRLAYIDKRLKDFRSRDLPPRRSESPF